MKSTVEKGYYLIYHESLLKYIKLNFPSASPSLISIHEETQQFEYIHLTQTHRTFLHKNDFLILKETKSYFHAIDKKYNLLPYFHYMEGFW